MKNQSTKRSSKDNPVTIKVEPNGVLLWVGVESGLNWARLPEYESESLNPIDVFSRNHQTFKEKLRLSESSASSTEEHDNRVWSVAIAESRYLNSCGELGLINEIFQQIAKMISTQALNRDRLMDLLISLRKLDQSS
jgi:hypothetical protein